MRSRSSQETVTPSLFGGVSLRLFEAATAGDILSVTEQDPCTQDGVFQPLVSMFCICIGCFQVDLSGAWLSTFELVAYTYHFIQKGSTVAMTESVRLLRMHHELHRGFKPCSCTERKVYR